MCFSTFDKHRDAGKIRCCCHLLADFDVLEARLEFLFNTEQIRNINKVQNLFCTREHCWHENEFLHIPRCENKTNTVNTVVINCSNKEDVEQKEEQNKNTCLL